ncbi:hypothetical protein HELRODRAFT_173953 [Helobdella robusta]|uniref:Uncharacterized protein n=1 Tax=Helobdella robusta TaxID=6412 RepID=T1F7E7_HELRO|nr:hypothetical protein HELRODRAFT_173953 [Helobdella robusta]ESO03074.1 hypothetical protein HELRODRAFT_173953 [Helobdella robusta]
MAALLNEILDRNKTCTNLISSIAHETNSRTNLATCNVYDTNVNRIKNETIDTSWSNILVSKTNKTDCELQSDDNVSDDRMTLVQRIFYIGNVKLPDSSKIEKHCGNRGNNLISCYPASKRVENDDEIKYSSFRLCIPAEEYGKVMTASNWPASVVIREWIFNKDNTNSSNTLPSAKTNASAMKDVNNAEENSGVSRSDI